MSLFTIGDFRLHSGEHSPWKINCDALTEPDWISLAIMAVDLVPPFRAVEGVPTGGVKLAHILQFWARDDAARVLIVDDVLTTGASMEEQRAGRDAIGLVVFARRLPPPWVIAMFQWSEPRTEEEGSRG